MGTGHNGGAGREKALEGEGRTETPPGSEEEEVRKTRQLYRVSADHIVH